MNIEVQINSPDGKRRWEKVRMLVDSGTEINLLSEEALCFLGIDVMPLEEDLPEVRLHDGRKLEFKGYVDLVWLGERSRKRFKTRFYVPTTETPEFEAILSRKTSEECGLLSLRVAATKTIQPKMTEGELVCLQVEFAKSLTFKCFRRAAGGSVA